MAAPPLLSWLWKNKALSDVAVHLCTSQRVVTHSGTPGSEAPDPTRPSGVSGDSQAAAAAAAASPPPCQRRGKAKVAKRSGRSATAPEATSAADAGADDCSLGWARSYPCHAIALACCSTYFNKRILGGSDGGGGGTLAYASSSAPAAAAGQTTASAAGGAPLSLEEHVEEGELDAMEAVLRHCYTGSLVEGSGSGAQLSIAALLQMLVLTDRFDVAPCLAHCCEELARRDAAEFDTAAINAVLDDLLPGLVTHAAHDRVIATATQQLLHVFGDAEAVCGAWYDVNSSLDTQLLQLSLPSLLVLLRSDLLKARSENSVLMLADAWVSGPAGAACSPAQRRQVAAAVRLGQLSPAFTLNVVPRLTWLQLDIDERESLVQFLWTGLSIGPAEQAALVAHRHISGPDAWYAAGRRVAWPGSAELVMQWDLTQAQLAEALQTAQSATTATHDAFGHKHFFGGFTVHPVLRFSRSPVEAAFGHNVRVYRGGRSEDEVVCRGIASGVTVRVAGQTGTRIGTASMASGWVSMVLRPPELAGPVVTSLDVWAPLLQDGQLRVACALFSCS